MVSISAEMVNRSSVVRQTIDRYPLTAAVGAKIDEAHTMLEQLERPDTSDAEAALSAELSRLDERHDKLCRGFNGFLSSLIELSTDADRIQVLRELSAFLLPDGLKITGRSYLEEAGRLRNLKETISLKHAELLKSLDADGVKLYDRFEEWCAVGEQMRQLDLQRSALRNTDVPGPSRSTNAAARNKWIAAVNALVAMADLAPMTEQDRLAAFGQLNDALERASNRGKKAPAQQPTPAPAPATDGDIIKPGSPDWVPQS